MAHVARKDSSAEGIGQTPEAQTSKMASPKSCEAGTSGAGAASGPTFTPIDAINTVASVGADPSINGARSVHEASAIHETSSIRSMTEADRQDASVCRPMTRSSSSTSRMVLVRPHVHVVRIARARVCDVWSIVSAVPVHVAGGRAVTAS